MGILVMEYNRDKGESRLDYILWLFESNKHYIRNLLLLYTCFYPIFALLDYYTYPNTEASVISFQMFVGVPFLITAYILSYVKKLRPYIRIINATALLAMNLNVVYIYANIDANSVALDTYYSGLMITLATLGLSMSCIGIVVIYAIISAGSFILVSCLVHQLHIHDSHLFIRSTKYILEAAGMFVVISIVIERFSFKLYKAQKGISLEKDSLVNQNDVLENLNDTKDRFFSIISHDLRSPFTALIGYFEILLRNKDKEFKVKKDDIQKIYLHTRRTYNLLNNLLNWSKAQLDQYTFEPKQYNLNDIFIENELLYKEIANQKEIVISHHFPDNASVYCDKEMVMTIIRNLIFNAIKFTKAGGNIYLKGIVVDENKMELAVIDDGIGISDEDIKMILNPSQHFTKEGTYNEKGAGIGLVICNDLLKKHHSKLQIESRKNIGSKFSFIIPMHEENENI
ncbi:sensor histidine kinase [Labilibacter marinus]|uniref:sensor histidine kinase n=1 Tax=Labilibacter marinus TaxID=1477105 RepID=UPI001300DD1F|nr:HAMP domain-containing sensor histidine kinase [Labilibacter marinus]